MILITGASKNIGKFLFEKYFSEGEEVLGTYYSSNIDKIYEKYLKMVDIKSFKEVENWIIPIPNLREVTLINCAGISYNAFTHKADYQKWREIIEVNLMGTFNCIRCVLPIMRKERFGRIINMSSVVAQKPTPGTSAYAASKSALWGLSKSVSVENASLNISINNINLGYANIGMGVEKVPQTYQDKIMEQIPVKRFCEPEEIFKVVQLLRTTPYINGTSIDLNGGLI